MYKTRNLFDSVIHVVYIVPIMIKVNIHEAKTHFPQILNRGGNGEDVVIVKAGKPIARIVPIRKEDQ